MSRLNILVSILIACLMVGAGMIMFGRGSGSVSSTNEQIRLENEAILEEARARQSSTARPR